MDLFLLNKSLTLRSVGRMASSEHPVFKQIWNRLKPKGFLNVRTNLAVDSKLKEGLKLLYEARGEIFNWPIDRALSNANLCATLSSTRLADVLTPAGRLSLAAFQLLRRDRDMLLKHLTLNELANVERFLTHRGLVPIVRQLITSNSWGNNATLGSDLFPSNGFTLVRMSPLTSKNFRELMTNEADQMICIYKCGLILTPGDLLNWTGVLKKLTSTKHRCAILRIAHGDVYTNERLARFGLIDNPKCNNCDQPIENLMHRIIECPKATTAWRLLESKISEVGLQSLTQLTIENVLGAGQTENPRKTALTLRAELASRLMTRGGSTYCPIALVRACIKTIYTVENLDPETKNKLKEILNTP